MKQREMTKNSMERRRTGNAPSRWGRAGRLLSCLLMLSLLCNALAYPVADTAPGDVHAMAAAAEAQDHVPEQDVEELQDVELGGGDEESDALPENTFLYNIGYDVEFLFTDIMKTAKLPIEELEQVEAITVLGSVEEHEDELQQDATEALFVEPVLDENEETTDYKITALRFFQEAGLVVYTADDMYTVRLVRPEDAAEVFEKRAKEAQDLPDEGENDAEGEPDAQDEPDDTAVYTYSIGEDWPVPLSAVLAAVGLDIEPTEVEMVAVLGDDADSTEPILVEHLDGDYLISVARDFESARLALYVGEDVYSVTFLGGIVPEVTEEPEIDLPVEEPTEEPTAEPTEEPEIDLPVEEPTEEPTAEPTEEPEIDLPVEEPTEEPTDEPTEEPTPEPTEEPTPEPTAVAYPAQTFTGHTVFVRVNVDAPEGAFPEGTTMVVKPVWDDATIEDIRDAVREDFVDVKRVYAVDIAFYDADGNEIEPRVPVSVVMSVNQIQTQQDALVVHVDDAGEAEIVEHSEAEAAGKRTALNMELPAQEQTEVGNEQTEVDDDTGLEFEADGFSVYAVVVTETIETLYIDANGDTYSIEVGYGPDAEIPSGATLSVSELTGEEAEAYAAQAAEALNKASGQVTYSKALDIAIVANGENVQPKAPVSVSIRLLDAPAASEDTEIDVVHFGDEPETLDCALDGETVAFESDGFSVYVVTFTYQPDAIERPYKFEENKSVLLSDLLFEMQIPKAGGAAGAVYEVEDVKAVGIDNPTEGDVVTITPVTDEDDATSITDWTIVCSGLVSAPRMLTLTLQDDTTLNISIQCLIPLTITAASDSKTYDGAPLTSDTFIYEQADLAEGDRIASVVVTGSQTDAGSSANVPSAAQILNAANEDVTANYAITYVDGTLTVAQRPLTVTAASDSKTYDGAPLTNDTFIYEQADLAGGDSIESVTVTGSQTNAGSSANVPGDAVIKNANDEDVTANYAVDYVNGTLRVAKRKVNVTVNGAQRTLQYNGQLQTVPASGEPGYTVVTEVVAEDGEDEEAVQALYGATDYEIGDVDATASLEEVGQEFMGLSTATFPFVNNSSLNFDATLVEVNDGYIEIIPREGVVVTVTGHSVTEDYDGTERTTMDYDVAIDDDVFTENDIAFTGNALASRTKAGKTYMGLKPQMFDSNNSFFKDVTFKVVDGYVQIDPIDATVTIKGDSVETVYDGVEYVATGYTATASTDLYDVDHFIAFNVEAFVESGGETAEDGATPTAKRTDAGKTDMHLAASQFSNTDANFANVTFTVEDGCVDIEKAPLRVMITGHCNEDEIPYDGEEHSVSGYDAVFESTLYLDSDIALVEAHANDAVASGTNAGRYEMGLEESWFVNTNDNFEVDFELLEDGCLEISPIEATVLITGAHDDTRIYNGATQEVKGFAAVSSTPLYDASYLPEGGDYEFSGTNDTEEAIASGVDAGVYYMNLSSEQFTNTNANFDYVEFEIVEDGWLTIHPTVVVTKGLQNKLSEDDETFRFIALLKDDRGQAIADHVLFNDGTADVATDENGRAEFTLTTQYQAASGSHAQASRTLSVPLYADLTVMEDTEGDANNYIASVRTYAYNSDETPTAAQIEEYDWEETPAGETPAAELISLEKSVTVAAFKNEKDKYCRVDDIEFQTLMEAVAYADTLPRGDTVVIEMLRDYNMPAGDVVVIPEGLDITLVTAPDYGTGAARITRTAELAALTGEDARPMIENNGTLNLGNGQESGGIILDGGGEAAAAANAMIENSGALNLYGNATLRNAYSTGSGGAVYNAGSFTVLGGSIQGNHAALNGGAILNDASGSLVVSGGTMTGNVATEYGGAIYTEGGYLSISGGVIGDGQKQKSEDASASANKAKDGAAVYVAAGTGNYFSGGTITNNQVTQSVGGAVGVANAQVKLYFSSNPYIYYNGLAPEVTVDETDRGDRNVILQFDSDTIINAQSLNAFEVDETGLKSPEEMQLAAGPVIGIYVPGTENDTVYKNRGMSRGQFASYSDDTTNSDAFKNDRSPNMMVSKKNQTLVWGKPIKVELRYLASFSASSVGNLPPRKSGSINKTYPTTGTGQNSEEYYPASSTNYAADIAADVRSFYTGHGISDDAVFACAYAIAVPNTDPAQNQPEKDRDLTKQVFGDYIAQLKWDSAKGYWKALRKSGNTSVEDVEKIVIYYSMPAYITISNNADRNSDGTGGSTLTISELTIYTGNNNTNPIKAVTDYLGYGYIVAKNGATVPHFQPLTAGDFTMAPSVSYKLVFPGARNMNYALTGVFAGRTLDDPIKYKDKYNGGGTPDGSLSANEANNGFTKSGKTYNDGKPSVEIEFGEGIPICKIGSTKYTTLQGAFDAAKSDWNAGQNKTTVTNTDGSSYQTIKIEMLRDYLIPDGDCPNITDNTTDGFNITLTTAAEYTPESGSTEMQAYRNYAKISRDQGNKLSFITIAGKVPASGTTPLTNVHIERLRFDGKTLASGDGGVLRAGYCAVTIDNIKCENFEAKNGGAVYVGVEPDSGDISALSVNNSYFEKCKSSGGNGQGGGAIWTGALDFKASNCQFIGCTASVGTDAQGGAVFQKIKSLNVNRAITKATISGCTFRECVAQGAGGGMELDSYANILENCNFYDCRVTSTNSSKGGGGCSFYIDGEKTEIPAPANSEVCGLKVTGCGFYGCKAEKSSGGALRTRLIKKYGMNSGFKFPIVLTNTVFDGNKAGSEGGAIWLSTEKATLTLDNCTVTNNTATQNGGGIHCNYPLTINGDKTISGNHTTISGNQAACGGGVYANGGTTTIGDGVQIENNKLLNDIASNAAGVYITTDKLLNVSGNITIKDNVTSSEEAPSPSDLRLPEKNGFNQNKVTVSDNLSGEIRVVNAKALGTQFGTASKDGISGLAYDNAVFQADNGSLRGILDTDSSGRKIIWVDKPICKIVGENNQTLYKDAACTQKAIYYSLADSANQNVNTSCAFGVLRASAPNLYTAPNTKYATNKTYYIKMLVPEIQLLGQCNVGKDGQTAHNIVLTTADKNEQDGISYDPDATDVCRIVRTNSGFTGSMFAIRNASALTFTNIIVDGNSDNVVSGDNGGIANMRKGAATIEVGTGAILQNSASTKGGGAILANNGGTVKLTGGKIIHCGTDSTADNLGGGAICVYTGSNSNVIIEEGSAIEDCWSDTTGGAILFANQGTLTMKGGKISGCRATTGGGGIDAGADAVRLVFSGDAEVYGNTMGTGDDAPKNNVQLRHNSNTVIQVGSEGLGEDALIGVYVTGAENAEPYLSRGDAGDQFAHNNCTDETQYLYRFVNDRNDLMGTDAGSKKIKWAKIICMEVSNTVVSDAKPDAAKTFWYKVEVFKQVDGQPVPCGEVVGEKGAGKTKMTFDSQGVATFPLKSGEYALAIDLLNGIGGDTGAYSYRVTEYANEGDTQPISQSDGFITTAKVNGNAPTNGATTTLSGELQGVTVNNKDVLIHRVAFTNTRMPATLNIVRAMEKTAPEDVPDFKYVINLPGSEINQTYNAVYTKKDGTLATKSIEFKNGRATTDALTADMLSVSIAGLPSGVSLAVTQSADANTVSTFNARYELAQNGESFTGAGWEVKDRTLAANTNTLTFTNSPKTGQLTISKVVSSDLAADKNKQYSFTVALPGRSFADRLDLMVDGQIIEDKAVFTYDAANDRSVATGIQVRHQQPVTIVGLPLGADYTVTEVLPEEERDYFATSISRGSGKITDSGVTARFTNTRKKGSLTIAKAVDSKLKEDATRAYTFTIGLGEPRADGGFDTVKSVSVTATTPKKVTGLPMGVRYTVVETTDIEGLTSACTSGNSQGTVNAATSSVTVTDTDNPNMVVFNSVRATGNLKISNALESDVKDDATAFTFKVNMPVTDTTSDTLYTYRVFEGEEPVGEAKTLAFSKNNSGLITLADGQSAIIYGLPKGVKAIKSGASKPVEYTVTQTANRDFTTKNARTQEESLSVTGSFAGSDDPVAEAAFLNIRKTGSLRITKTVSGSLPSDRSQRFAFHVNMAVQETTTAHPGYSYDVFNKDGTKDGDTRILTFDSTGKSGDIRLKDGQYAVVSGLPHNVDYTVTEDSQELYTTTVGLVARNTASGKINATREQRVAFTNTRKTAALTIDSDVSSDITTDATSTKYQYEITLTESVDGVETPINATISNLQFDAQGKATVVITGDASKSITLPVGVTYSVRLVKVQSADGTDVTDLYTTAPEANLISGTLGAAGAEAAFTNTRKTDSLTITKTVVSDLVEDKEDAAGQEARKFSFTVSVTSIRNTPDDADGYSYTITTPNQDDVTGELRFSGGASTEPIRLKHGQSVEIEGLPKGAKYTVAEATEEDFTAVKDIKGSVGDSGAAFTNVRKTGKLTIQKNVVNSLRADMKDQEYTFHVQLGRNKVVNGESVFKPDASFNGNTYTYREKGQTVTVEFRNNTTLGDAVGEVVIKGIGAHTLEGLPQGITCKVTEESLDEFDTTPTDPIFVTIDSAAPVTAAFTNQRKGNTLSVKKTVVSDLAADKGAEYRFRVTLLEEDGETTDTSIGDSQVPPGYADYGAMRFTDGVAEIDVEDGQTVTAEDLPTGVKFRIEEISYANGKDPAGHFVTTILQSGAEYTAAEGTIGDGKTLWEFVNTCAVCKITAGGKLLYLDAEKAQPAAFTTLEAAFAALDSEDGLYDENGVSCDSDTAFKVEMLVGEYTLDAPLALASGDVTLTTASKSAARFPYTGTDNAVVKRGFNKFSMITVGGGEDLGQDGELTLANIVLDGNNTIQEAASDGGIVNVAAGSLAVQVGAKLQNSITTGAGGAVFVASGASMTMTGGEITGNRADEGGAVDFGVDVDGVSGVLYLSGSPVIYDNKTSDGQQKNIVLNSDSSEVIRVKSGGLTGGTLGVYVVSDPEAVYANHGLRERPFATFEGVKDNADVFKNDRKEGMTGVESDDENSQEVVWSGKLEILVCRFGDTRKLINNKMAVFELVNAEGTTVWKGRTNRAGRVRIPWVAEEAAVTDFADDAEYSVGGATLAVGGVYKLWQRQTDSKHTLPNNCWTLTVNEDYSYTFVPADPGNPTTKPIDPTDSSPEAANGDLLYTLYNVKVESYEIKKIWLDETGSELSQGDDKVKDLDVTFQLYSVSRAAGITYGDDVTEPPFQLEQDDIPVQWTTIIGDTTTYPNTNENLNMPIQLYMPDQPGFMPLTLTKDDGTVVTKWYIIFDNITDKNLAAYRRFKGQSDVIEATNSHDKIVAFSGRVWSEDDVEPANAQGDRIRFKRADRNFLIGDILVYNDQVWIYKGGGNNEHEVNAPGRDVFNLLGPVPTGGGNSSQSMEVKYDDQAEAVALAGNLRDEQGLTVNPVSSAQTTDGTKSGPYTIRDSDGWSLDFINLDGGYVYYAVETKVLGEDVTALDSPAKQWYNPTYVYGQTSDTVTIKNRIPDYVARVSNDDGDSWSYHIRLISDSDADTGVRKGAFNRANELEGDVIVELLKQTHDAYALASGFDFNGTGLNSLTLRATEDLTKASKRSTITAAGADGAAIIKSYVDTTITDVNFTGGVASDAATMRAIYMASRGTAESHRANLNIVNSTISGFKVSGDGGALYLAANTSTTFVGTITGCSATNGGAVYAASGATLELAGHDPKDEDKKPVYATITGNSATAAGAGIYLEEGGQLKLSGTPNFGGADLVGGEGDDKDDIKGENGNFLTGELTNKKNGQKAYAKARQDIYIADTATPLGSLVITGALNMDAGSVWVWANHANHNQIDKQFALFDASLMKTENGETTVNLSEADLSATLRAFRNAQTDDVSKCTGNYLFGVQSAQEGEERYILWGTDGVDVRFKKVNGLGEALQGALFTLYEDAACTTARKTNGTDDWTATSDADGAVLFEKAPVGVNYIRETTPPAGYAADGDDPATAAVDGAVYVVLSGSALIRPTSPATDDPHWGTAGDLANLAQADIDQQTGTDPLTKKQFAIFKLDGDGKAASCLKDVTAPDIAAYGILDPSANSRKVILRKVNGSDEPIAGAKFKVYRWDMTEVVTDDYTPNADNAMLGSYVSGASGAYFVGKLPLGTYYLLEYDAPTPTNRGVVYELTVGVDTSTASGIQIVKQAGDPIPVANAAAMLAKLKEVFPGTSSGG